MDKSFNDQELSDIMKEIEALEDGFNKEQEVLGELAEMPASEAVPFKPKAVSSPVIAAPHHSSMSFKVHGELHLNLEFEVGGKIICMKVSEDGLHVVVDGGMTFTVPVKEKKAA